MNNLRNIGWKDNNDGQGEAFRQATGERSPTSKIHLIRRIDCLKSNWWLWEAERESPSGRYVEIGTVQADHQGEAIAPETWDAEE